MSGHSIRRRPQADESLLPATLHPLLRRLYSTRGLASPADLELGLDRLIPVRQLGGIDAAVDLLCQHFTARSRVLIVGDFDADGATSTALVVRQLARLGFAQVDFLVPNRFEYGYGLTPEIVRLAATRQPALIVTVDNGIASHAGVLEAKGLGIEVLVTDHHLPAATLPEAAAIVNPNSPGDEFPSKALAGVGVAFYLMAALTREMQIRGLHPQPPPVADLLDLVALGTVADLVPLDRNNRVLVQQGLRRIRAGRCVPGIRMLLETAGRSMASAVASDLGYQVGPRLNAAGRLDDMTVGIQCLLADDLETARLLAGRLTQLNHDRRELELQMQQEAMLAVADMRDDASLPLGLCLFDETWHQGVVGLVASRVKERVHRPVIALARGDQRFLKGSARSVSGVHIRDVLDAIANRHPGLIEKFGGHAMAAGLTLPAERLDDFRAAFDAEVSRWMTRDDATGVMHSDGDLAAGDLTLDVAHLLRESGPWGQAFPEPLFDGEFTVRTTRVLGERHLRMDVQREGGAVCEAIAFRHFDHDDAPQVAAGNRIEIAYRLDVNRYNGTERLQLVVEHLRVLV
ncbi:single-stranded-DNA-specific exonuclease RecJ [Povalibacter sp.]|uniref:single-stranded-DNA-specific exonuclease RecJ n=1 Tax=Povalibacter sp. TaxID=1962978 RepID=UPI002F3F32A0